MTTSMTTMDDPTRLLRYNRSLFDIVRATPLRSAGYLYVCAYLVPELVAELFAELEGERS